MGLDTNGVHAGKTRLQQVADGLENSQFLARLRKKHQVTVVPFNNVLDKDHRVVLPMQAPAAETADDGEDAIANREKDAKNGKNSKESSEVSPPPASLRPIIPRQH